MLFSLYMVLCLNLVSLFRFICEFIMLCMMDSVWFLVNSSIVFVLKGLLKFWFIVVKCLCVCGSICLLMVFECSIFIEGIDSCILLLMILDRFCVVCLVFMLKIFVRVLCLILLRMFIVGFGNVVGFVWLIFLWLVWWWIVFLVVGCGFVWFFGCWLRRWWCVLMDVFVEFVWWYWCLVCWVCWCLLCSSWVWIVWLG